MSCVCFWRGCPHNQKVNQFRTNPGVPIMKGESLQALSGLQGSGSEGIKRRRIIPPTPRICNCLILIFPQSERLFSHWSALKRQQKNRIFFFGGGYLPGYFLYGFPTLWADHNQPFIQNPPIFLPVLSRHEGMITKNQSYGFLYSGTPQTVHSQHPDSVIPYPGCSI